MYILTTSFSKIYASIYFNFYDSYIVFRRKDIHNFLCSILIN